MELAGLHEKLYKAEVGLREALGRRDAAHEAVQALEGQVATLQEEERRVVARLQPQLAGGGGGLLLTAVWADQESEDAVILIYDTWANLPLIMCICGFLGVFGCICGFYKYNLWIFCVFLDFLSRGSNTVILIYDTWGEEGPLRIHRFLPLLRPLCSETL